MVNQEKVKQVYIVQFDWSVPDDKGIEIFVYDSFEKGYQKFKSLIEEQKNPDISWVGDIDWKDEHDLERYELYSNLNDEKQSPFWCITDLYEPERFIDINLFPKKIL